MIESTADIDLTSNPGEIPTDRDVNRAIYAVVIPTFEDGNSSEEKSPILPKFESILNPLVIVPKDSYLATSGEIVFHCTNGACEACIACAICERYQPPQKTRLEIDHNK